MSIVYPYSFAPGGLTNPGLFNNSNPTLAWSTFPITSYKTLVKEQMNKWAAVCGIMFFETTDPATEVGSSAVPQMRIYLGNIDGNSGQGNWAAAAYYPTNTLPRASDIMYDSSTIFIPQQIDQFSGDMLHELGHAALDLRHGLLDSVMTAYGRTYINSSDAGYAVNYAGPKKTKAQELAVGGVLGRIFSAYIGMKNNYPDNGGLYYWSLKLTKEQMAGSTTSEWQALTNDLVLTNGISLSDSQFVTNMYVRILGRSPTSTELSGGVSQVQSQGRGAYLRQTADSAEAASRRNSLMTTKLWFE